MTDNEGICAQIVCCDDLDLAVSGKRSTPMMEEKTVLLQSTPGSEVIGYNSTGDIDGQRIRGSSSINGSKEFPRTSPEGGE